MVYAGKYTKWNPRVVGAIGIALEVKYAKDVMSAGRQIYSPSACNGDRVCVAIPTRG